MELRRDPPERSKDRLNREVSDDDENTDNISPNNGQQKIESVMDSVLSVFN